MYLGKGQSRWKQTRWHTSKPFRVNLRGHPREHSREHSSGSLCMGLYQRENQLLWALSCTLAWGLAWALAGPLSWEHWWGIFRFRQLGASLIIGVVVVPLGLVLILIDTTLFRGVVFHHHGGLSENSPSAFAGRLPSFTLRLLNALNKEVRGFESLFSLAIPSKSRKSPQKARNAGIAKENRL